MSESRVYALVVELDRPGGPTIRAPFPEPSDVGQALTTGLELRLGPGLWVGPAHCVELDEATPYEVAVARIDPGLASGNGSR